MHQHGEMAGGVFLATVHLYGCVFCAKVGVMARVQRLRRVHLHQFCVEPREKKARLCPRVQTSLPYTQ